MSETASTMIKLLIAISSTKANIRYVCIPIAIFFSWKYFVPVLSVTDIPVEYITVIAFVLGIGVGSLIGSIFYKIYTSARKYRENSKKAIEDERLRQDEEAQRNRLKEAKKAAINKRIKESFDHLTFAQRNILITLTKNQNKLDCSGHTLILLEHDFIRKLTRINGSTYIVEINPMIADFLNSRIDDIEKKRVIKFFESNPEANELLSLLETDYLYDSILLKPDVIAVSYMFSSCIQGEHHNSGIRLFFVDGMKNAFEKYTGKAYLEERPSQILCNCHLD
tara:strand:+ start:3443 stop:4282 length:840 start_codon:yes stop_codon:yes gene_type:complete